MESATESKKRPKEDYRIDRPETDDELVWVIATNLDEYIEFHEGEAVLQQTMEGTTPGQRVIYACTWYDYEVCNGGHQQFFWNSTGILWDEALAGFTKMGAVEYAAILKAAVSLFPNGTPSKDRNTRKDQLSKIREDDLDRLDKALYELKEQQSFDDILNRYVMAHPQEFFISRSNDVGFHSSQT